MAQLPSPQRATSVMLNKLDAQGEWAGALVSASSPASDDETGRCCKILPFYPPHFPLIRTQKTYRQLMFLDRKCLLSLSRKVGKQTQNTTNAHNPCTWKPEEKKTVTSRPAWATMESLDSLDYTTCPFSTVWEFVPKQIKEPNQLKQINKNPISINNQTQQTLSLCHGNLCLQLPSSSTLRNPKENISVKSNFSSESDLMVLHTFNWKAEADGLLWVRRQLGLHREFRTARTNKQYFSSYQILLQSKLIKPQYAKTKTHILMGT